MIQIKFNVNRNFANFSKEGRYCIIETNVDRFPSRLADELDKSDNISVMKIETADSGLFRLLMVPQNIDDALSDICEAIVATYGGSIIVRRIKD